MRFLQEMMTGSVGGGAGPGIQENSVGILVTSCKPVFSTDVVVTRTDEPGVWESKGALPILSVLITAQ